MISDLASFMTKGYIKLSAIMTVYDRLYLAGQNLMSVIEASRGCPNKELGKLTDQITALIEKYKQD